MDDQVPRFALAFAFFMGPFALLLGCLIAHAFIRPSHNKRGDDHGRNSD